jgi:hypothetical protein
MSVVVMQNSLYAIGGHDGGDLDLMQRLNLETLTWELLQTRLPQADSGIPSFKLTDSQAYFLLKNKTVYSFHSETLQVKPVKTLSKSIQSCRGPSYYSGRTLYCSNHFGASDSFEV